MWDRFLTRDQTLPPALGAWSLNYWTTREIPVCQLLKRPYNQHFGSLLQSAPGTLAWMLNPESWQVIPCQWTLPVQPYVLPQSLGPQSTPTLLLYKLQEILVPAWIYWPVYLFPVAAVTKYHKSSDFNRNASSQGPGDQKSKMSPTGLTSQCQQEEFTWEAPGEIYSMSSPVSGGFWHSLACGHITPVSMSIITLSFWPWPVACGLLVPWPGFKLAPPAMEDRHLNRWTAREVPTLPFSFL